MSKPPAQARNPLHGVTLQAMVEALVAHFGWLQLGQEVPIRCFTSEPSVASSLRFLRKTPWAREKVESLYLFSLRERTREDKRAKRAEQNEQAPLPVPLNPSA